MNLADALRRVNTENSGSAIAPAAKKSADRTGQSAGAKSSVAGSGDSSPVASGAEVPGSFVPAEPTGHVHSGNVVRLELFLSAEQMGGLFKAIMAGQHTVLTVREAASYLRISQDSLVGLAEEGEIPGVLIEGRWRFPKPSLDDWLTRQSVGHEDSEHVA